MKDKKKRAGAQRITKNAERALTAAKVQELESQLLFKLPTQILSELVPVAGESLKKNKNKDMKPSGPKQKLKGLF
eukprot:15672136-Heterocapsa_arctica.AAC.1